MLPFLVLLVATLGFLALGATGVSAFKDWRTCLRWALALMFFLTASAHWGKRRPDLVRMVPASIPRAGLIVSITGMLEILGAVGLLIPAVAPASSLCLALLLVAMFPANIRGARENVRIGGRPPTSLGPRALLQLIFICALLTAGGWFTAG